MQELVKLQEKYGKNLRNLIMQPAFFIENFIIDFKLTDYQKEWLHLCRTNSRLSLQAFRSSGKTEVLLVDDTIHWAFTHPGSQQLMISNTLPQATELLRRIKDRIVESEMLRTAIDSNYWTKTDLTLKNKARILCKPYNENVRMLHVDRVKCDEMGEYRDHSILKGAVFPTLTAKHGDFCGVGTPKSEIDILHELKKDSTFKSLIYPAFTKEVDLFHQRYPNYEVKKKDGLYIIWDKIGKKAIGSYTSMEWSREFMCKCLSSGDRIYPFDLIEQSFLYDRKLSMFKKPGATYYIGLDFALSTAKNADRSAFFVIERFNGKDTLCWIEHYHGLSYMAQKKRIEQLYEFYRPSKMVCDQRNFGESFFQEMRSIGVQLEGFSATNQTKQELIQEMRARFESNFNKYDDTVKEPKPEEEKMLFICKDRTDFKTNDLTEKLVKEMLAFSIKYDFQKNTTKFEGLGAHDDMVMALGMALWASRVKGSKCFHVARGNSSKRNLFRIA